MEKTIDKGTPVMIWGSWHLNEWKVIEKAAVVDFTIDYLGKVIVTDEEGKTHCLYTAEEGYFWSRT